MTRAAHSADAHSRADPAAREILIPLVGTGVSGALARIAADGKLAEPHQAQLDRRVSALLQSGLYPAGEQALAAVRLLSLPRERFLTRATARDEALHVVNPGDIRGLGPENSSSSELGLALALLMLRAQTPESKALASGALDLSRVDGDVPVLPVHHLGEKLRLVMQHFEQPGSPAPPRWFLVPTFDPDGSPVHDRYRSQCDALRTRGIELRGVRTLGEAARILGAHRYAPTRAERLLGWSLGAVCAGLALVTIVLQWLYTPIPLSFAPIADVGHTLVATPARARMRGTSIELTAPCELDDESLPAFTIGQQMAMRVRAGRSNSWIRMRYHLALVAVSASSGAKILPVPAAQVLTPGGEVGYRIDVRGPEEDTLLIWLAKRGAPFDLALLQDRLRRAETPGQPAGNISAVRNVLQHAAPGVLTYYFRSVAAGKCP